MVSSLFHKVPKGIRIIILLLLLLLTGSLAGVALIIYVIPQKYQAVVISGNTVLIVLQKPKGQKPVIIALPEDTYIVGLYGYGVYSLSALWKLGALDTRGGMLLADSLSATLGLPVGGYIETSVEDGDPQQVVREVFGWRQLPALFSSRLQTNIPFFDFIGLIGRLGNLRPGDMKAIDLGKTTLFEKVILPDGSSVSEVDPERIDPIIGNAFENEDIRMEAKRVAVINTTPVTGLGSIVARELSHVGAVVVSVTNSSQSVDRCRLELSKAVSASLTVKFIQSIYDCDMEIEDETGTTDIRFLVGSAYAKRFLK